MNYVLLKASTACGMNLLLLQQVWKPFLCFFQDATDRVFQKMIIAAFPLEDVGILQSQAERITYEDANIVRYIAGYVCRKVRSKIESSLQSNKVELLNCVEILLDDEEVETPSSDWVAVVGFYVSRRERKCSSVLWKKKCVDIFTWQRSQN